MKQLINYPPQGYQKHFQKAFSLLHQVPRTDSRRSFFYLFIIDKTVKTYYTTAYKQEVLSQYKERVMKPTMKPATLRTACIVGASTILASILVWKAFFAQG